MIFNYGTLELFDPALKDPIYIFNIASPKNTVKLLKKYFLKERFVGNIHFPEN